MKAQTTWLLLFIIAGVTKLIAQEETESSKTKHTISGYITESGSGENLPAVSIYVEELALGTTTNSYGFFSLTMPTGTHTVTVSYLGYETIEKNIDLTRDVQLNFELLQDTESLEEVIIDGDRGVNESEVTQMSVVSLKPSEVNDIPVILGEKDVIKTLQLLPGIQGGTEGTSGFFVRGGTPDQNLIILDEAPVYNSNHLFGIFSVFNGNAIQSINTYKGGFPARYGGRLSSVLDIQMKNGNKEKFSGKFDIGLISSSLLLEGPINKGKTSFIVSGRRTYLDLLSRPFQPKGIGVQAFFTDLNFKIHHVFDEKNKLYWSNYFGQDKFSLRDTQEEGEALRTKFGWGNITSTLRWNHQFSNKFFSNTSLIFSNYNVFISGEDETETDRVAIEASSGINDYGAKIDFDYYPNPKHAVRFGASTTYHNFTPRQSRIEETGFDDIAVDQKIESLESAVYVEDDWKLSDKLSLYPGFRLSHFQYQSTSYLRAEPRMSVAYKVKEDLALKASYSRMNQYIHLLSNTNIGLPIDLWVSSTDLVKPQVAEQFAIGAAKDFFDEGYSISLEGYYKEMDDIIGYREGASFIAVEGIESGDQVNWEDNITSGNGWAYGTELLFRKKTGKLTGWLGYTLSWSERQFDELNRGERFFARYDRRHDISLVGIYKPSNKITLSGAWVLSTGNNFTIPDQTALSNTPNFPIRNGFFGSGITESFTAERNNFRAETYHRFDLGIQFHKKLKSGRSSTKSISIYNIYARRNPFYYYTEQEFDFNSSEPPRTVLKRISILQFIPSFTYTYKF